MKKNVQKFNVARKTRIEALETRQMLDAMPIFSPVTDPLAEISQDAQYVANAIDLSKLVTITHPTAEVETPAAETTDATVDVVFTGTDVKNVYTMDWTDMEGAASYNVKISRDGGETWITYRKTTESECEIRGAYAGNTYMFRIFAVNEAGKLNKETVVETSFTPVDETASREEVSFTPNGRAREYTMAWQAIDGAAEYHVRISRDGGETWLQYRASSAETSCNVKGLYPGKTYMFQIIPTNAEGRTLSESTRNTVMSPIAVNGNLTEFMVGDTLEANVVAANGVQASLKWYAVTPDGDVEIAGTEDDLTTIANATDYPIKVVATGLGDAQGSVDSYVFSPVEIGLAPKFSTPYDAEARTIELSWNAVEGAAKYVVQKMTDAGTWAKAATLDSATTSYTIRMLNVDEAKSYRVVAQDAAGIAIEKEVVDYTAFAAVVTAAGADTNAWVGGAYENGETLNVNVVGIDSYANVEWSRSTDGGATWTTVGTGASIQAAANGVEQGIVYKAVVTAEDGRQSVGYAYPHVVATAPSDLAADVSETGALVLNFNVKANTTGYSAATPSFQFQYNLNGVWTNLTNVTVTANGDGTFTATHPNSAGVLQNYEIRVRVVAEDGVNVSYWDHEVANSGSHEGTGNSGNSNNHGNPGNNGNGGWNWDHKNNKDKHENNNGKHEVEAPMASSAILDAAFAALYLD